MKITRTKNDICFICKIDKSTQKGSHLMPAGFIASCVGARGKELQYAVDTEAEVPMNPYYGSANKYNNEIVQDTAIRENINVQDYIFCPSCEKKLADLESKVTPFFTTKVKTLSSTEVTSNNIPYIVVPNNVENPDLLKLFVYSLIYRLCLTQLLYKHNDFIGAANFEALRRILCENLDSPISNVLKKINLYKTLSLTILTTNDEYDKSSNAFAPYPLRMNPYIFGVNEYVILCYFDGIIKKNKSKDAGLPFGAWDNDLINLSNNKGDTRIGLLTFDEWQKFIFKIMEIKYRFLKDELAPKLAKKQQTSYDDAHQRILSKAKELNKAKKEYEQDMANSYREAFDLLMAEI